MTLSSTVTAAAGRLSGRVHRTPVFTSATLDKLVGRQVFLKAECLQKTGSFKIRGALNTLLQLPPEVASRGVVTHSSGNHGQGLAAAAQQLGIPCTVVVPDTTADIKVSAIRDTYDAKIVFCEPTQKSRTGTMEAEAARGGMTIVHPYNNPNVMAGQGTIGLEMVEQIPDLDAVIVPTSGGGMIGGIAMALAPKGVKVFAAEPKGKRLGEALVAQQRVISPEDADKYLDTICDAIRTMAIGEECWPIVSSLVEKTVLTVDDDDCLMGMQFCFSRMKLVVEPASATGVAALLKGQANEMGSPEEVQRIGVVLCGGNVDSKYLNF